MIAALLLPLAWPCDEGALRVRTVQPRDQAEEVPLDTRVVVSFIGEGQADHYTVALEQGGASVATSAQSWCYDHEGPLEVHCWIALTPAAPLTADTAYTVRIQSTERHTGQRPESLNTRFTTGSAQADPVVGAPGLRILAAWDVAPEERGVCDWERPRRYTLELTPAQPDPSALSLYQVWAIDPQGQRPEALVHTIFVQNPAGEPPQQRGADRAGDSGGDSADPAGPTEYKQFLDGDTQPTDCFRVVQENAAGQASASVEACWAEDTDSGGSDSGGSDSGTGDSGADDSADDPADDSRADDSSPPDSATGPDPEPRGSAGCGCGAAGALALLPWIALLRRRAPLAASER